MEVWELADRQMREVPTLTDAVVKLAKQYGWLVFRVRSSRPAWNLGSGFPDLCLARQGRIVFAELKRETEVLDAKQVKWIDTLGTSVTATGPVDVFVWRPSDLRLGHIEAMLV